MNKKIYIIIVAALSAVFLFSTTMLLIQVIDKKSSVENFDKLEQIVASENVLNLKENSSISSNNLDEEKSDIAISAYDMYKDLYALNNDFVGWISIENTNINYPVMQTVDKPNFYLKRDFEKNYSDYGVPYVDEKCGIDLSNNTIIYGHNMKNGTMFADLLNYTSDDFYQSHKTIKYDTLNDFGEYEIISVFKIDVSTDIFFYTNYTDMNENEFKEYISAIKDKTFYDTGIKAEYGDMLLTLSTCEDTLADGRLVVVAKKII